MNTPNKLTLIRVLMVPIFLFVLLLEMVFPDWATGTRAIAGLIFIAASVTDMIDWRMARKYNLVTNFGKFLDPVADKVLVFAALIAFIELGLASSVAVVIMMAREFLVSSMRMVAASKGKVIAAGKSGKVKTAVTMVSIVVILLLLALSGFGVPAFPLPLTLISNILIWICAALTIYSGAEYLIRNREVFTGSM